MRILVVAATVGEVAPLAAALGLARPASGRLTSGADGERLVDLLVTGVGMVATAAHCSMALAHRQYDLALNVGVCGSFNPAFPPGTVVHVVSDCMPDFGAEDGDAFLTIQQLGLLADDQFPFAGGRLVNQEPPSIPALATLPAVHGVSVNSVHGRDASIADVVARFQPDVESMEGAAFMYSCLLAATRFAQVRAVSNRVERRNRSAWHLSAAVDALAASVEAILEQA
jgi:futalosine hydrolase